MRSLNRGGGATGRTVRLVKGSSNKALGTPMIGSIGSGAAGAIAPTTQHTAQSDIMAPSLSGQALQAVAHIPTIADAGGANIGDTVNAIASMVIMPTHRSVVYRNQARIIAKE